RAVIIAAPGYEYQLSLANFVANLLSPSAVSLRDVIFQGLLSQNVVFIAAGFALALYLKTRHLSREFAVLGLAFIGLCIIALADGVGVNVGRVGGMLTPIFAALAANALFEFDKGLGAVGKNPPKPTA